MKRILFKKLLILIILLQSILSVNTVYAQNTNTGIYFQAVARDNFSNPAKDRKIYVQSSIIQTTANGTKVLTEEYQTNTDAAGVFSISLGQGTRVGGSATNIIAIDWSSGPYYLNLKVVITPIAPLTNWDYTKEWIDLGTTSFGAVPYAMYSASSAKVDDYLNVSDTTTMLKVYAKAMSVQAIEKSVASKLTAADTLTMLAPYAKASYTIDSNFFRTQLATKLNLSDTIKYTKKTFADSAINKKINIADSGLVYVTPLQLKGVRFDTTSLSRRLDTKANATDVTTDLALKENISNKSTAVDLGGTTPSDVLFPTQKAVKDYLAANNAGGGVADGGITTIKIADAAVTDAKINTVSGSKVVGNITGNAATATLATNATTAGNITATSNTTLTSLSSLTGVGTITSGTWSGTAVAIAKGGTGLTATGTDGQILTSTNTGTLTWTTATAAKFTNDVTIKLSGSKSLGKYANGATIPTAGKTLDQFLLDLVQESVPPTYTAPTVSIGSTQSGSYEIGTNINVTLSNTFTQNNGGSATGTTYYKNSVSLGTGVSTNNHGVLSTSISYSVTVTYGAGTTILNNNLGTPDATGQIPAGSKSSSLTISPFAYKYWGSSVSNAIDDATLRAGTNENSGKAKSSFTIPISGSKYIFYAYPASLGVLSSISVGGFDSFDTFTKTTRDVTNASGYTQSYNIYISNNRFTVDVSNIIIN